MSLRLRAGPFRVSSRGRVGVRAGPVSWYGGGRRRRSSSSSSDGQGCAIALALMIVAAIFFAVFIAPAAVIGHLLGVTPNLAQVFGKNHGDAWMDAHYPDVVGRFVLVDLALFGLLIAGLVLFGKRRAASAPWLVRYECRDGSVVPGVDRYPTREAADAAAAKIGRVIVSGEERPVRSRSVVMDPTRDPATKKRKRQQALATNRSHAYCPVCHRRFYAGERSCECGHRLGDDWEQQFVKTHGVAPEARPGGPRNSPLNITRSLSDGVPAAPPADLTPVQEASRDARLVAQLRELADLHRSGDLSDAEFERAKARLISG